MPTAPRLISGCRYFSNSSRLKIHFLVPKQSEQISPCVNKEILNTKFKWLFILPSKLRKKYEMGNTPNDHQELWTLFPYPEKQVAFNCSSVDLVSLVPLLNPSSDRFFFVLWKVFSGDRTATFGGIWGGWNTLFLDTPSTAIAIAIFYRSVDKEGGDCNRLISTQFNSQNF